jgi:CDP-paratose 2-epimerase
MFSPESIVVYSSTNKVYGDIEWVKYKEKDTRYVCDEFPLGFPETIPLEFHSPYGCSKGSADQYMLDFHRIFGTKPLFFATLRCLADDSLQLTIRDGSDGFAIKP